MLNRMRTLALAAAMSIVALPLVASQSQADPDAARVAERVRKEIVTLPFYSVFDFVTISVDGDRVTLDGNVYRRSMVRSVERVAANVEGVSEVVNNVEAARVSNFDDRIRLQTLRAIYSHQALNRYGIQSVPPIHILVDNGNVTLEGVVNRKMEKDIAGILANGIFGVFSVTNNLRVDNL